MLVYFAPTMLSRPRVINMKKNMTDQKGAPGMRDRPSGYATNANPGPLNNKFLTGCFKQRHFACR